MAAPAEPNRAHVEVEGRELELTNLDKVLFPEAGFTKADLIDYYRRIAPVLLKWLAERPVTFRRFPDGVEGSSFYEKHLPRGAPSWIGTVAVPLARGGGLDAYPAIDSLPALLWAANLAVIEFHVPMWRIGAGGQPARPDLVVFDLDPGLPAGITECCRVALELRRLLEADGYEPLAKTSGSKGVQLYARRPPARRSGDPSEYARGLAERLAADPSSGVVANMRKELRRARVLVDWSQNNPAKTTVAPYSLRARARPGVSTPLRWSEIETVATSGEASRLVFEPEEVLQRVEHDGDLFAPLLG